jgi:predicted pyridoxine 5'-phosphate oxidase superfamily flavin-nucleotide-binding protein
MFTQSQRRLQDRFDSARLADRIESLLVRPLITADDKAFIESLPMFFLATKDAAGHLNCSYKGGDPGFVRVTGPAVLTFPVYDGNGMFLSAGNLEETAEVGLLFIDFLRPKRLRLNGTARLLDTSEPGAQFMIEVTAREVFPNCPRYIHRMDLAEASVFVPRPGSIPPVPGWKRSDWARDVLPEGDPARDPP